MTRHQGPAKTTLSRLQHARHNDGKVIRLPVSKNDARGKHCQERKCQESAMILPFHTHRVAR
jgi:hypothetical protein